MNNPVVFDLIIAILGQSEENSQLLELQRVVSEEPTVEDDGLIRIYQFVENGFALCYAEPLKSFRTAWFYLDLPSMHIMRIKSFPHGFLNDISASDTSSEIRDKMGVLPEQYEHTSPKCPTKGCSSEPYYMHQYQTDGLRLDFSFSATTHKLIGLAATLSAD